MVSASTPRFNVVTHGLMWFWEGSDAEPWHIYIPEVISHFYLIGDVATSSSLPGPIGHQQTAILSFTSRGDNTRATADPDENLVLYRSRGGLTVDSDKLHATIELPMPNEVTVLRCGDKPSPAKFFAGDAADDHDVDPARLSLVQVLSYFDVEEPIVKIDDEVVFQGTDNFHVYAEPLEERGNHFSHLIETLNPPPVDLRTTPEADEVTAPDFDPNGTGIMVGAADQKGLVDLRTSVEPLYSRPTNCMAAFLVP